MLMPISNTEKIGRKQKCTLNVIDIECKKVQYCIVNGVDYHEAENRREGGAGGGEEGRVGAEGMLSDCLHLSWMG